MRRVLPLLAVIASASCGGGNPPPQAEPEPESELAGPLPAAAGTPAVIALIGARERLGLTSAQVIALDSIGGSWRSRNDALVAELRRAWGDRRPRNREGMERARPLFESMGENNDAAARGVEAVLTPEQRQTACELQREAGRERAGRTRADGGGAPGGGGPGGGPRGGRAGMGPRGGSGMRPDSVATMRRGWPWCPPPMEASPPPAARG